MKIIDTKRYLPHARVLEGNGDARGRPVSHVRTVISGADQSHTLSTGISWTDQYVTWVQELPGTDQSHTWILGIPGANQSATLDTKDTMDRPVWHNSIRVTQGPISTRECWICQGPTNPTHGYWGFQGPTRLTYWVLGIPGTDQSP